MKYIVYKNHGKEFMVTFPGDRTERQHKEIAEALGLSSIIAAGFFLELGSRKIFDGESTTLNIKSRGEVDRDLYIEQTRR